MHFCSTRTVGYRNVKLKILEHYSKTRIELTKIRKQRIVFFGMICHTCIWKDMSLQFTGVAGNKYTTH